MPLRTDYANSADLYREVTNQIISMLEAGTPPWIPPWDDQHGCLWPTNLTTGRRYRGINVMLLNLQQQMCGFPSNRWLTFQQAQSVGARIGRGASGTRIVFFKLMQRDDSSAKYFQAANDEPRRKVVPLLRSFVVFNESQGGFKSEVQQPQPRVSCTDVFSIPTVGRR